MDRRLLEARLNLAKHFLQHTVRRLFSSQEQEGAGLTEFFSNYGSDNIYQISSRDRDAYSSFSNCIQCSVCQPHCVMYRALNYLEFPGPMAVASTLSRALDQFGTTAGVIYNCTMCRLCEITCPESAPVAAVVGFMRRYLYQYFPDLVPPVVKEKCETIRTQGNYFGKKAAISLPEKDSAEYVLFLGCHGLSQRERTEAAVAMLHQAAVDFTVIDEVCCGAPLGTMGCDASETLAKINIERIREKKTAKVITLCPHCLISFSEDENYAGKIEAAHITEFLARMHPQKLKKEVVTYHDPCMLSRVAGIIEEPRQALAGTGAHFVEMNANREMSFCCGNWGGLSLTARATAEKLAQRRLEDARSVGADVLLTECSWCLDIFKSVSLAEEKPRVRSILEYLHNPEQ